MVSKILGWIWLTWGIIFLLRPQALKTFLRKKASKKVKRFLFMLTIAIAFLFIVAGLESEGVWAKVFMLFGIIAIIKGFFLLKGNISDRLMQWFGRQPLGLYRIMAVAYIILGIIFLKA